HWLGPVFLGAAWTIGVRVTESDDVDAVVCGPDTLEAWADGAAGRPVFACSLLPLGVRFGTPLPPHVHDVDLEVWSQPDSFIAWDPPTGTDAATDDLTQDELMETVAVGSDLTDGGRLLSVAN